MTLEEAIKHCHEVFNKRSDMCQECRDEHLQLAKWLEELKDFKNKADFVEVVRCRDCKYLYCFSAIDRQFYCKHYPKGLQGINIVEENPFCSYGERKDT